jgi:hypothetical protein
MLLSDLWASLIQTRFVLTSSENRLLNWPPDDSLFFFFASLSSPPKTETGLWLMRPHCSDWFLRGQAPSLAPPRHFWMGARRRFSLVRVLRRSLASSRKCARRTRIGKGLVAFVPLREFVTPQFGRTLDLSVKKSEIISAGGFFRPEFFCRPRVFCSVRLNLSRRN